MNFSTPGLSVLHHLLEFAKTLFYWVSDAIHPIISTSVIPFSSCCQCFPASGSFPVSWLFTSGSQNIGSFTFNISPSNENSGLISSRIDWFDLAVQGTLKSLLQHHSSKASILWCSAFFIVQLSHPYMCCWKNHTFDYMDLCWQCLCFLICCLGLS